MDTAKYIPKLHRTLDEEEEFEFRLWARENYRGFNSPNGEPTNSTWHPVVLDECERMRNEYQLGLKLRLSGMSAGDVEREVQKVRDTYDC
jgi:hypothetical protein